MDILNILIERVQEMLAGFVRTLPQLALALLVLLMTWVVASLARAAVHRMTRRTRLRPSLVALFVTLTGVLVWIFGILVALAVLLPGVNAGSLLAVLGLGSVAIGFAFKDIFENFLAGVLIMLRKKMRIGDMIECEGVEGRVEVFAREFNESSIDFTVRWWSGSEPIEMHRSRDRVLRAIKAALDQAGIEIPFPQVTNWFKEPLRVERQDG
ncbi:MAG TPA: mechanosensitive ion channel domain-containing protein [Sphingomicrobium sp.]|nr:mechanosensitive ion channel domain-containing protein [Sphingomicrobium sp.]